MEKTITLSENDWGQIIDGLTCRAEDYDRTAQGHESGFSDDYILDVRDAEEARDLARHYRRILQNLRGQLQNV